MITVYSNHLCYFAVGQTILMQRLDDIACFGKDASPS